MNISKIGLSIVLVLFANQGFASSVFLETFTSEDASYVSSGWILSDDAYIGIRFTTTESINLSGIVGNIWGSGNFFAAITLLSVADGYPSPTPGFLPDDLIAYSEVTINSGGGNPSEDNQFSLDTSLAPGNYFVFFGTTDASSFGYMPWATDLSQSNIPLTDYLEYSLFPPDPNVNGWFEFQDSGVRVALLSSPVPIPGALGLFASGLMFLGIRRIKDARQ